jgi:hypothetical protein
LAVLLGITCLLLWPLLIVIAKSSPAINNRWNVCVVIALIGIWFVATVATTETAIDRPVYMREFRQMALSQHPLAGGTFEGDQVFTVLLWALAQALPSTEIVLYSFTASLLATAYIVAARLLLPLWGVLASFLSIMASGLLHAYSSIGYSEESGICFRRSRITRRRLPTTCTAPVGIVWTSFSLA